MNAAPASSDRRPLASRDTGWARRLTRLLAATAITPNQVSVASMAGALAAGLALWGAGATEGAARGLCLLVAAAGCQFRLLCNLLDGLLAVEAGRSAPDGPFWNEVPDRVSDLLILAGLGLGAGLPALGWAAAALAVLTAYLREMGTRLGFPADWRGPMAKPQRMAAVTLAALAAIPEPLWGGDGGVLRLALWAVALGTALTALRRAATLVARLRAR